MKKSNLLLLSLVFLILAHATQAMEAPDKQSYWQRLASFASSYLPDVNVRDKHGNTLLMQMIIEKYKDSEGHEYSADGVINILLWAGADVNAQNNKNETPMMLALQCENYDVIQLLAEYGAERIEFESDLENLPVELKLEIMSWIPDSTSAKEFFSKLATLALINKEFADLAQDKQLVIQLAQRYLTLYPATALEEFKEAAGSGNFHIVKALLDVGIVQCEAYINEKIHKKINAKVKRGKGLVAGVVKHLREQFKRKNCVLDLAFLDAVLKNQCEMAQFLMEQGAQVNAKFWPNGFSPLMFVAKEGDFEMVRFLIDRGADINQTDVLGLTVLNYAKKSKVELVRYLLDHGASRGKIG